MAVPIQSPAKREVLSVIGFLNTNVERPAEIHKQIVAVCDNVMNRQNVTQKCREFSEGRTDVNFEKKKGRPSLISDDFLQEMEGRISRNRRVTIRELNHIVPEVSKTTIHEAVTEKLEYTKLCVRWVPKILTDDQKTKWIGSILDFLTCYAKEGDEILYCIVTGDETLALTTLRNPSNSHCNGAIQPPVAPYNPRGTIQPPVAPYNPQWRHTTPHGTIPPPVVPYAFPQNQKL